MRAVFAIALSCLTGGCLPAFNTIVTDIGPTTARNVSIHSTPADLRSTLIVRNGANTTICLLPAGDVAYSRTADTSLGLLTTAPAGDTGVDLDSTVKLAAAVSELKGRTETVLLARDMLNFVCTQSATQGGMSEQTQANFSRIADMLENFSEADRSRAAEGAARAVADATRAGVDAAEIEALYGGRRTVLEQRVGRIAAAMTTNSALDNAKRDALLAKAGAVLAPGERAELAQASSLSVLTILLRDLSPGQLAALEGAI